MLDVVLVVGEEGPGDLLLDQLAALGARRVVLVGGSPGHPALEVVTLPPEEDGPGRALLRGLLEVAALPGDPEGVVVTITSPRTRDAAPIPTMLRALEGGAGLVVASRFAPGGRAPDLPWYARMLAGLAYAVLGFLFPIEGVRDYTSGYRAFRRGLLARALRVHGDRLIEMPGQAGVTELLVRLARFGVRCTEVPLALEEVARVPFGPGKVVRRAVEYLRLIRRLLR